MRESDYIPRSSEQIRKDPKEIMKIRVNPKETPKN